MEKKEVVQVGFLGLRNPDGSNTGVSIPLYVPASSEFVEAEKRMIEGWLKDKAKYIKDKIDAEDAKKGGGNGQRGKDTNRDTACGISGTAKRRL